MKKDADYAQLVTERCSELTNPADVEEGRFDSEHVGAWSLWQGSLNAPLMVVGQDRGDTAYFVRHAGRDKGRLRMLIRIPACVAFAAMLSGCGSSADPTSPTSPVGCSAAITIGIFSNGAPASPGQGMVWTSYFQATVLPAQPSVYVVDINSAPAGCLTTWTAVSANTSAVQLSPASGTGRSQVELFMPANTGAQRSTLVTIAGQTASIAQAGR